MSSSSSSHPRPSSSSLPIRSNNPRRVDTSQYEIRRRSNKKPQLARNHFYISSRSNPQRETDRIEAILRNEFKDVTIHGMGISVKMAISVAIRIEKKMGGAVRSAVKTSTVTVKDDLFPLSDEASLNTRSRPLSAVHIRLIRIV